MLGISASHLIILGIVLLIVGPKRLPEVGRTLGRAFRNFKDGIEGVKEPKFHRLDSESLPEARPSADSAPGSSPSSHPDPTPSVKVSDAEQSTQKNDFSQVSKKSTQPHLEAIPRDTV